MTMEFATMGKSSIHWWSKHILRSILGWGEGACARCVRRVWCRVSSQGGLLLDLFAGIARGRRTALILVRRAESKSTSSWDKLGHNVPQFAREFHDPHVPPFIPSLTANPSSHIYLRADGPKWYQSAENKTLGPEKLSVKEQSSHSAVELFAATQEEWGQIDQGRIGYRHWDGDHWHCIANIETGRDHWHWASMCGERIRERNALVIPCWNSRHSANQSWMSYTER
jgi:hypothetical protein